MARIPLKPLRLAGAAFLLLIAWGCAPVSPYRTQFQPSLFTVEQSEIPQLTIVSRSGLKVLLRRGSNGLKLRCPGGIQLIDPEGGQKLCEFGPGSHAELGASQGQIRVGDQTFSTHEAFLQPLIPENPITVGAISYRGKLFLEADGDNLLLVNDVSLDEYLYGVLPGEVGSQWPMEALKAQAVAARTYAVFRAETSISSLYDLDDSTRSQVYFGTSKESDKSSRAVDDTSELILTWHGKPAETYFHANSGGHTADAATVWGAKIPYLRGVDDPYCKSGPHYAWHSKIDHDVLLDRLAKAGVHIGDFDTIKVEDLDESGRCQKVLISGEGSKVTMSAQAFRIALGPDVLCSTNFSVSRQGDTEYFKGKGWGHGVGLCQEGAWGMAKDGYRFDEILSYYFPGTHLQRLVQ